MQSKHDSQYQITRDFKIRLIWEGILIGISSGLLAVFYRFILHNLDNWREYIYQADNMLIKMLFLLSLVPLGALVVKLLAWAPLSGGSGIPQIKAELLGRVDAQTKQTLVSKFIGGSINNFVGLSLGREGPSIQLGGTLAKSMGKLLKRDKMEINYLISAGASAGLSAAFNAPVAGTLFVLEELYGSFSHYVLVPSLIASLTANYISFNLMGMEPAFSFTIEDSLPIEQFQWIIIIGILAGIVGGTFNVVLEWLRQVLKALNISPIKMILASFFMTFMIGHFAYDLLGGGHHLIEKLADSQFTLGALVIILVLKLLFTCISFDSGAQGGIFLPVLVLGATCGLICFKIVSFFTDIASFEINFMIIGMAAVLAAVIRAPLMSIILVTEMTGSFTQMLNITIAVMVAFIIAEHARIPAVYETLYHNLIERIPNQEIPGSSDLVTSKFTIMPDFQFTDNTLANVVMPAKLLVIDIEREGSQFMPKPDDILKVGDQISVLHDSKDSESVAKFFKNDY